MLRIGDLELNPLERRVSLAGKPIDLTPRELALLEYLMLHNGESVSRAMIWKVPRKYDPRLTNAVDVYVTCEAWWWRDLKIVKR